MTTRIKHLNHLQFTVVATPSEYGVDYAVYDHACYKQNDATGKWDVPCFTRKDAVSHPDPVKTIEEAQTYLHGYVKWDGCSNWHFDEQDRVMLHGCTREGVQRFGDVMAFCWDWTSDLLEGFAG